MLSGASMGSVLGWLKGCSALSPHLDSHVVIHVLEMGGKALHVHTALRLEVAEAC